jgi:putative FmdB family regulatory protein
MPIYEYECTRCGRIVEAWQKFSDTPLKTCKHCSGKLHKLISESTFHLKGTGWYVTDYANKSRSSSSVSGAKKDKSQKKAEKSDAASTGSKKEG